MGVRRKHVLAVVTFVIENICVRPAVDISLIALIAKCQFWGIFQPNSNRKGMRTHQ